jgi:hypothetical protein
MEEDTRELLARLQAEIREHDEIWETQEGLRRSIERYLETARRIQAETGDPETAQRLLAENQLLEQALAALNDGWRREHARLMRLLNRKQREECGLKRPPDQWVLCKLRWQRDARWVMVRPGDAEMVAECACTIWGQRRYFLPEEMIGLQPEDWHRKVIRLTTQEREDRRTVVFYIILDRHPEMILGYEGMTAQSLREMIRARFRIEDCVLPWGEQPVDESWANDWRVIQLPLRGGRRETVEEEEEPDDSEESEEEDTDPETQSVEETRELLERLEEETQRLNEMVARYGEEAIRIQDQLDDVRDQRREADNPRLRDDMRALKTILRDVTSKLRRARRQRTRLEERCERERRGDRKSVV